MFLKGFCMLCNIISWIKNRNWWLPIPGHNFLIFGSVTFGINYGINPIVHAFNGAINKFNRKSLERPDEAVTKLFKCLTWNVFANCFVLEIHPWKMKNRYNDVDIRWTGRYLVQLHLMGPLCDLALFTGIIAHDEKLFSVLFGPDHANAMLKCSQINFAKNPLSFFVGLFKNHTFAVGNGLLLNVTNVHQWSLCCLSLWISGPPLFPSTLFSCRLSPKGDFAYGRKRHRLNKTRLHLWRTPNFLLVHVSSFERISGVAFGVFQKHVLSFWLLIAVSFLVEKARKRSAMYQLQRGPAFFHHIFNCNIHFCHP